MCDCSSSTFQYRNNTTITNNNHNHNHNHIDYHDDNSHDDDNGHHNHHNNFITTKKKAARTKTGPGKFYYEAYISKYRLLYMVVSEPIKSFMGYLRKGNTGWELIHIPFCTLL